GDPMAEGDRERALPLARQLPMPVLARAWQMLLKGIDEVQTAPAAKQAADMVLVRLAYVADLPVPAELVRSVTTGEAPAAPRPPTQAPVAVGAVEAAPPAAPHKPPPAVSAADAGAVRLGDPVPRRSESGSAAPALAAPL